MYRIKGDFSMKELIHLQKIIFPDLLETMQNHYTVLNTIHLFEPIGRRGVIDHTNLPERSIRNEITLLNNQGLIDITTKGMFITEEGENIINRLHVFIRELSGLTNLEK